MEDSKRTLLVSVY